MMKNKQSVTSDDDAMANFHRISKKFSENLTLLFFKMLTVRIFATAHIARPLAGINNLK